MNMDDIASAEESLEQVLNLEAVGEDELCSKNLQEDTLSSSGVKGDSLFVKSESFEDEDFLLASFNSDQDESHEKDSKEDAMSSRSETSNPPTNETFESDIESSLNMSSLAVDPDEVEETCVEEEYLNNPQWINREKHIFILSESGKPIYTRYGKEDRLVTLFGLMQALVSFVADGDDTIRCINAGGHKFVFLIRTPLILIAVSRNSESVPQLMLQLACIHSQVLSVLPSSSLKGIFEKRRNYDFRNMLGGTDRLLDNLIMLLENHPSYFLGAIKCIPLASSVRDIITQTITQYCTKIKELVFGLMISNNKLLSLVRVKKYLLHPADLHLLFNLVSSTESLKTSENWIPLCLPKFDSTGYLYAHVSYLADDCEACLILLSVNREQFFPLSEAKQKIVSRLRRHHCLEKINQALRASEYNVKEIGASELRHFLYKSKSTAQYTSPGYSAPYNLKETREKLSGLYRLLHHRIHSVTRPLKMMYMVTSTETVVGWITKEFELYAALEPLTSKEKAVMVVNRILQWIKSEETKHFILNSSIF